MVDKQIFEPKYNPIYCRKDNELFQAILLNNETKGLKFLMVSKSIISDNENAMYLITFKNIKTIDYGDKDVFIKTIDDNYLFTYDELEPCHKYQKFIEEIIRFINSMGDLLNDN